MVKYLRVKSIYIGEIGGVFHLTFNRLNICI
jgi:hypothetical protein